MDKEYTAGEAKAWLNGYDEGKKIRTSEKIIQTSDSQAAESERSWVGLTDGELLDLADMAYANDLELLQTLQAKLKEKNHG